MVPKQTASITIEEFQQKIQEVTNYPLRPFAVPFLKMHLPILQQELLHSAKLSKTTASQYVKQHQSLIMDTCNHPSSHAAGVPFEIFQPPEVPKEHLKRHSIEM